MANLISGRILVTGGTSGLGRAMAAALIKAGAVVAITSRTRSRAETVAAELGAGGLGIEMDVRDQDSVQAGVGEAFERLGSFLVARDVVPRMLAGGGGRIVSISMNEQTMTRRGFVPYGPSGAGVEALAKVMAADLAETPVRANILLPGGATATGMIPDDVSPETRAGLLDPGVMGPPIVWLASAEADGVHGERIVAAEFEEWLGRR
jgi:NAD(P)-dependent dehydrogenase (short-subunit alcohol dehydrogenase family)